MHKNLIAYYEYTLTVEKNRTEEEFNTLILKLTNTTNIDPIDNDLLLLAEDAKKRDSLNLNTSLEDNHKEQIVKIIEKANVLIEEQKVKNPFLTVIPTALQEETPLIQLEEEEEKVIIADDIPMKRTRCWISSQSIAHMRHESIMDKSFEKEKSSRLNSYIKKIVANKELLTIENYDVFDHMLELAPNFAEVIQYYKGSFILNQSRFEEEDSYFTPTPILLLGDPGVGKTYFAKLLARSLGTTFNFMDANSITASWVLTGGSSQWRNSDAGLIFKYMLDSSTISPVVIFDEIDKLSNGKNYDPFSVFHQLLEPESAKSIDDEFIDVNFDASNIIYILTANKSSDIPESLLSRMKVFDISAPDKIATRKIAQHMYEEIIGKSPLFTKTLTEEALHALENFTPRKMKQILNNSIFKQASTMNLQDTMSPVDLIVMNDIKSQRLGF